MPNPATREQTVGQSAGANANRGRWRSWTPPLLLLGCFFLLESRMPLRTAVEIGADEGFELGKATLCLNGYKLYSQVWNDQPPLHTFLVTEALKHLSMSVLVPRLLTVCFAGAAARVDFRILGYIPDSHQYCIVNPRKSACSAGKTKLGPPFDNPRLAP